MLSIYIYDVSLLINFLSALTRSLLANNRRCWATSSMSSQSSDIQIQLLSNPDPLKSTLISIQSQIHYQSKLKPSQWNLTKFLSSGLTNSDSDPTNCRKRDTKFPRKVWYKIHARQALEVLEICWIQVTRQAARNRNWINSDNQGN